VDTSMLRKWLKAGYLENYQFHATEEGTPQGGLSALRSAEW
jgi:RNA-directed DNA polymerase